MPTWPRLLAMLALVVSGCASHHPFLCSARGGPAWREVSTDRVTVRTELDGEAARELTEELHRLTLATEDALGVSPPAHAAPIRVIAYRHRPSNFAGASNTRTVPFLAEHGDRPIVLFGGLEPGTRAVFAHSVAHAVLARAGVHRLRWFVEGSAAWAETLGNDGLGARPEVGGIPVEYERHPRNRDTYAQRVRVDELFFEGVSLGHDSPFTRSDADVELSWRLVHMLRAGHREAVLDYQARVARGDEPGEAWAAAFPRWDPRSPGALEELDRAVRAYLPDGARARPVALGPAPATRDRALTPAEVHTLRLLAAGGRPVREGDVAEAEEALGHDPGHVAALWTLALHRRADAPGLARRAVDAHPDDPLAWRLAALAASDAAARDAALRRGLGLAPDDPALLGELSTSLASQGNLPEALALAERRLAVARGDGAAHGALPLLHAATGRCDEARAGFQRAAALLPVRDRQAAFDLLAVRVDAARRSCPALVVLKGARL